MSDFDSFDGGVSIRATDGRFQPVKTPDGYSDNAFRNALAAFDTAYRVLGKVPSIDELFLQWPKIPKSTYASIMLTTEFRQSLRYRGIELDDNAGLSYEQHMAILKLSDHFDRRGIAVKLKELGIPTARYQNWMKQPLFRAAYERTSKEGYADALPAIRTRLIGNAESGEQRAIEMVFAITGEWNPAAQEVQNAQAVVMAVVEAVIKHVKDAETRKQIMADVALVAGTLAAVEGQKSLEG